MKTRALIFSDIRFQFRYGFYSIYCILTLVYIALLQALPDIWRQDAALIMIFTDPASMGLFFMGAIVLLEKNERVLDSLAVSPVRPMHYVFSKLVSIGCISTLVALVIGAASGMLQSPLVFLLAVFLCSCLFSALGLIAACKIKTLNQFFLAAVPAEILIVVPALLWMFWVQSDFMMIHPGASMLMLCSGEGIPWLALLSLAVWTAITGFFSVRTVDTMLKTVGGFKL